MRTPTNERLSSGNLTAKRREASASEPERRCVLSGETQPSARMLRLAVAPDGAVLPDPRSKAPGRGAWISVSRSELEAAIDSGDLLKALRRAFKGAPLTIADELPQQIEQALRQQLLDRLGLEMRSGHMVLGTQRIAEQARSGRLSLICHASDASSDGTARLDQAWRVGRAREGSGETGLRLPLDRQALSVALGRGNVVHMALADSGGATRLAIAVDRLTTYIGSAASSEQPADPIHCPEGTASAPVAASATN